MERIGKEKSLR